MNMDQIDEMLMGEFKGESQGLIYAKGVGKATAILWSLMHSGNEDVRKAVESALLLSAKSVEESKAYLLKSGSTGPFLEEQSC